MQNLNETIRERAYHLWVADGRKDGNADAYWLAAQREILATSMADGAAFERFARIEPEIEAKYPAKKAKTASTAARKSKRRAA